MSILNIDREWINLIVIEDYIYREINNGNECLLRAGSYPS
jgi:hypothetical protein